MHRCSDRLISAKGETEIRHPAACVAKRIPRFQGPGGENEITGIGVMLFNSGGNRQDIRIEDDVLLPDACIDKQGMAAFGYRHFPLIGGSLSLFIKEHHHHGMSVPGNLPGMPDEAFFAFLQADGVYNPPALHLAKGLFDYRPVGGVDHD